MLRVDYSAERAGVDKYVEGICKKWTQVREKGNWSQILAGQKERKCSDLRCIIAEDLNVKCEGKKGNKSNSVVLAW